MGKPGVKIGPWGGNGGTAQDINQKPERLVSMTIHSGDVIDAISFTYVGSDYVQYYVGPWGGNGGKEDKITLDPTDYVTEISGTTEIPTFYDNYIVTSLKIVTFKGNTMSYGTVQGTHFRIPVHDGGKIVGFFGRSGNLLDAIGLYINP